MVKVSLILIKNEEKTFQEFLESLDTQTFSDYELIIIDNCHNQYDSARQAFNSVISEAKGEYLIFLHPDIRFLQSDSLEKIVNELKDTKNFGVIGVAGSPSILENNKRVILSTIVHGKNKEKAGKIIKKITEVQTVDECFFIVKNKSFEHTSFSAKKGWHLYAVELCLDFLKNGNKNYVIPAELWHLSSGKSLDYRYVIQIKELVKEHEKELTSINTTVKKWPTSGAFSQIYTNYYIVKQWLKGKIKE